MDSPCPEIVVVIMQVAGHNFSCVLCSLFSKHIHMYTLLILKQLGEVGKAGITRLRMRKLK